MKHESSEGILDFPKESVQNALANSKRCTSQRLLHNAFQRLRYKIFIKQATDGKLAFSFIIASGRLAVKRFLKKRQENLKAERGWQEL